MAATRTTFVLCLDGECGTEFRASIGADGMIMEECPGCKRIWYEPAESFFMPDQAAASRRLIAAVRNGLVIPSSSRAAVAEAPPDRPTMREEREWIPQRWVRRLLIFAAAFLALTFASLLWAMQLDLTPSGLSTVLGLWLILDVAGLVGITAMIYVSYRPQLWMWRNRRKKRRRRRRD